MNEESVIAAAEERNLRALPRTDSWVPTGTQWVCESAKVSQDCYC